MAKIKISIKDGRPSVRFRGTILNSDIEESIKVLRVYVKPEFSQSTRLKKDKRYVNDIDIPMGDCNGKE